MSLLCNFKVISGIAACEVFPLSLRIKSWPARDPAGSTKRSDVFKFVTNNKDFYRDVGAFSNFGP